MQANGLQLRAGQVIVVAITATLAAIGSASLPSSALVSMVTVLQVRLFKLLILNHCKMSHTHSIAKRD